MQSFQLPFVSNNACADFEQLAGLQCSGILYSKALSRFVYPLNEFTYAELNPDHLRKVLTLSERV